MSSKEDFYLAILDNVADGVYFCDRDRTVTFWNKGAERITGYAPGDILGRSCSQNILVHVDERGASLCRGRCPMVATLSDGKPRESQAFLHHKDGHRVPVAMRVNAILDDEGNIEGAVETFNDNSVLRNARQRLDALSVENETDALTGIANRKGMTSRLEACLGDRRPHTDCAVIYVDIDHFKAVNDTYGHETGDRVLKMVAATLERNLRASDALGRWGGEEFVGLLYRMTPETLAATTEKLRLLVESAFIEIDGAMLRVTVSMGATFIRADDTLQSVTDRADRLLYQSKTAGRNRVTIDDIHSPETGPRSTTDSAEAGSRSEGSVSCPTNGGGEMGCSLAAPASSSSRVSTRTRTQ